eukprot:CAMPEP_0115865780 /NCGR_PEP_ID=MMETSP0287-20121206/19900_1 /TAXON_ID=412157 /ORGANISM="Chrysochromulina rotalis, Strain UIO044" /LENGTH=181 /DNA_ID=CAMNT_0003320307 /DNA_START=322 /DNA_END=864 /DNA_ORIENTATION=-
MKGGLWKLRPEVTVGELQPQSRPFCAHRLGTPFWREVDVQRLAIHLTCQSELLLVLVSARDDCTSTLQHDLALAAWMERVRVGPSKADAALPATLDSVNARAALSSIPQPSSPRHAYPTLLSPTAATERGPSMAAGAAITTLRRETANDILEGDDGSSAVTMRAQASMLLVAIAGVHPRAR